MNGLVGMNERNRVIAELNPRRAVVAARDKLVTKARLADAGIPVPPTLLTAATRHETRPSRWSALPDEVVIKPARGSQGRGVLVARHAPPSELAAHARSIVDGHHCVDGDGDVALVEPLLRVTPDLADLAPIGLPDIRVVVLAGRPLMAMLRLPTVASGGVGNLHRGGVGAAIDLRSGRLTRAALGGRPVEVHPDTGARLVGRGVPCWHEVLDIAAAVAGPSGLGYLGADLVVDATLGVVVLEVNSHPGLEIQNVHLEGLDVARSGRSATRRADRTAPRPGGAISVATAWPGRASRRR